MDLSEIKILVDEILELQKDIIKDLENRIDYVINKKVKDDDLVAELFDVLLNLLQTDEVLNLYKKLGRYYYFVNPYLVSDYINIYKDMYLDSEDEIKILKL